MSELITIKEFEQVIADLEKMLNAKEDVSQAAGGVPSGLIAIFDAACPADWTRVAAFDDKFLRGAAAYGGVGGAAVHNHAPGTLATANCATHLHSDNPPGTYTSYGANSARRASAGGASLCQGVHRHYRNYAALNTGSAGAHNHEPIGGTTGNSAGAGRYPLHYEVIFCKKD